MSSVRRDCESPESQRKIFTFYVVKRKESVIATGPKEDVPLLQHLLLALAGRATERRAPQGVCRRLPLPPQGTRIYRRGFAREEGRNGIAAP